MKKSKLLLVLVVALLVCSMVLTLVACGPKDNEDTKKPEPEKKPDAPVEEPTDAELSAPHIKAFNEAVVNSLTVTDTKKVGIDYALEVPVADTEDGKPQVVMVSFKALLDTAANNASRIQLAAKKKVGTADPAEVFTFTAGQDIYVSYPVTSGDTTVTETRKFKDLGLPAMMEKLSKDGLPAGSALGNILGMAGAIVFGHAETNDDVIAVDVKLDALGGLLVNLVGGLIDKEENYGYVIDSVNAGVQSFLSNIAMTLTAKTNAAKSIDNFGIEVYTPWGEGHVSIDPKIASDLAPAFVEPDDAKAIPTNVLNFTLAGKYTMDQDYTYNVKADLDLISVVRNVATKVDLMGAITGKTVVGKGIEKIFDDSTTKVYAEVKNATDVLVAGLAIDYKADQTIHALVNKTVPLLGIFLDGQTAYDKNADFVTFDINVAKLLADKTAPADPNAPAKPGKGVELVAAEPNDTEYAAAMKLGNKPAGTVSWTPVKDETYKVYVQGVEQTLEAGVSSVKATSGQVVKVDTVDATGKVIATSSKTYVDGRATAKAVAKFVSFLTATDFDYTTGEVVFDGNLLNKALAALDFATDIKYKDTAFKDIYALAGITSEIRVSVDTVATKFYDAANPSINPIELLTAAANPVA